MLTGSPDFSVRGALWFMDGGGTTWKIDPYFLRYPREESPLKRGQLDDWVAFIIFRSLFHKTLKRCISTAILPPYLCFCKLGSFFLSIRVRLFSGLIMYNIIKIVLLASLVLLNLRVIISFNFLKQSECEVYGILI